MTLQQTFFVVVPFKIHVFITVSAFILLTHFAGMYILQCVVVYFKDCASLQFLKSESDLEYIEKRLKLDFINSIAENSCHAQAVTEPRSFLCRYLYTSKNVRFNR